MPKDNSTDSYCEGEVLTPCYRSVDFYQKRKKGKYRLAFAPKVPAPALDSHCHIEMLARPYWSFIRCALHNVGFVACVIDSVDDGQNGIDIVQDAYSKAEEELPKVVEQIKNLDSHSVPSDPVTILAEEAPQLCLDLNSICDEPKLPKLRFIIGCHPHYAKDFDCQAEKNLRQLLEHPLASCVGEIGLDYHYDLSPRNIQVDVFKRQIQVAKDMHLPIALHLREAHDVALDVFKEVGFDEYGTLLHCFNLGADELKPWVDNGCYIALGGPITFKKSFETRDCVHMIPQNKLLTETDAPFMTPEPLRGDTCFPDHVIYNSEKIAEVLGFCDLFAKEKFYLQVMENAHEFFSFV